MKARATAIQVLARVRATDAYLNVVLDAALSERPLADVRDTGLVTELVYGTTRRELTLDYALARFSSRRLATLEDRVLAALRVGAYQLFYTRIPRRAAVAETVEAVKELGLVRAAGFVNAILRKLSALEALPLPDPADEVAHLAVRESHPEWLVRRWLRHFGRERTEAMLVADNTPPSLALRANTTRTTREALLARMREAGLEARPTRFSPVGILVPDAGRVEDLLGYDEGLWQVQDEAAQLVGVYAALPDGARVLDACAAPGGKACHLAERLEVVATDVHAHKLRKLEAEAGRLGLTVRLTTRQHDMTRPVPEEWGGFHAALVDAPCSGLGTLRRHPELRYRRKEEDIARLAALQGRILQAVQEAVPPGGLLVYAVCTTEPQEGTDQVELFLRSHPAWTAEPPLLPSGVAVPLSQGSLRTLPGPEGMDGFFAARLRRLS